MDSLPPELQDKIADAACKIRSNGKTSQDLQLLVRTSTRPSSCEKEVTEWVLRCLEDARLDYVHDGAGQEAFRVVTNVVYDIAAVEVSADGTTLHPERVFAIHVYDQTGFTTGEDGLIVVDEAPPRPHLLVEADTLKAIMVDVPPPLVVTAVGISAVSENLMSHLWDEIVSTHTDYCELPGKGYMVHPMWMRFRNRDDDSKPYSWCSVRETSCNFNWKMYNMKQQINECMTATLNLIDGRGQAGDIN